MRSLTENFHFWRKWEVKCAYFPSSLCSCLMFSFCCLHPKKRSLLWSQNSLSNILSPPTHLSYEFSAQYSTFCLSFLGLPVFHNLIVFYVHLHHSLPLEAIILLNAYTLNLPIPLRFSHTKYSHTSFSIAVAFQGKLQLIIKLLLLC